MINWKLESLSIKDLKEHKKNPRQITRDKLENLGNLIEKFGLIDKPIVNRDMTIIGGHQRIKYLKGKKVKIVDCWVPDVDLSEEDVDELCIGFNLQQGSWDWDVLANEWEPLDLLKYGFTEEQLLDSSKEAEKILDKIQEEEKKKNSKTCPACGHEF